MSTMIIITDRRRCDWITENKTLSVWQLCHDWWHRKLSLRQLTAPPVTTKLSNWQPFVFSDVAEVLWNNALIARVNHYPGTTNLQLYLFFVSITKYESNQALINKCCPSIDNLVLLTRWMWLTSCQFNILISANNLHCSFTCTLLFCHVLLIEETDKRVDIHSQILWCDDIDVTR